MIKSMTNDHAAHKAALRAKGDLARAASKLNGVRLHFSEVFEFRRKTAWKMGSDPI